MIFKYKKIFEDIDVNRYEKTVDYLKSINVDFKTETEKLNGISRGYGGVREVITNYTAIIPEYKYKIYVNKKDMGKLSF